MDHQEFPGFLTSNLPAVIRSKDTNFMKDGHFSGSYKQQLTAEEKQVYNAFYQQYVVNKRPADETFTLNFDPPFQMKIDYSDQVWGKGSLCISPLLDVVCSAYAAFSFDHPEVYWVRGFGYNYYFPDYTVGDPYAPIDTLWITGAGAYEGDYAERGAVSSGYTAAVNAIRSSRASASRYDTLMAAHDYVCEHSVYNYDALYISSDEEYRQVL